MPKPKQKKCREKEPGCQGSYTPRTSFQTTCHNPLCAIKKTKRDKAKKEKAKRVKTRAEKRALKGIREWTKDAQYWCNKYIRLRDHDRPCISCGKMDYELPDKYGGKWDAGHFLTRGSRRWIRYHPYNLAKQCKPCNAPGPYKAAEVARKFRENLIERVGLEMVEYLENNHDNYSFSVEDLQEIVVEYKERIKSLKSS